MATINFDLLPPLFTPQKIRVWVRTNWGDVWTERPDLTPLEAQWTLAPDSSTATLHYRFGRVLLPGAVGFTDYTKITARGYFVLIEYPDDAAGAPWYWLGYAESPIDVNYHPARDGLPESGEQQIPCFDLSEVLDQQFVNSTIHVDPNTPTEVLRKFGGAIFNRYEKGNRHDNKRTITENSFTSDQAYPFELPDKKNADYWSTRDIVEYIFAFHLPTPTGIKGNIPWTINNLNLLPDWDRPTLTSDARSAASVLNELVTQDRLLSWGIVPIVTPGSPPNITALQVFVQTTIASPLTLPAFGTLPANTQPFDVINTTDAETVHEVSSDDAAVVDQVTVRGPREIGIGTFAAGIELDQDWTAADESEYSDGASASPGFAGLELWEKRARNDRVRVKPHLQKVFRRLKLLMTWDGNAQSNPVFVPTPDPPNPDIVYVPYLGSSDFMETLPLYSGITYTGDPTLVDESGGQELVPPIVSLENPENNKRDDFKALGQLQLGFNARQPDIPPFSTALEPNNDNGPKVDLMLGGVPNYAVAGPGYVGNDGDRRIWGNWNWRTLEATLAIQGDRRPYWSIPDDATVASLDAVRRRTITIEDRDLELVHIGDGTTVGFDPQGDKQLSTGGVLRDPSDIIKSLATLYAQFHLNPRKRVTLTTGRRPTGFGVGGIIKTISNYGTVDAVIRSIRLSTPLAQDGKAITEIIAAREIFDPMQLLKSRRARQVESETAIVPGFNKREAAAIRRAGRREQLLAQNLDAQAGVNIRPRA